jgi:cellulose synthase/poly-beta-1,6-N-acetylglucosamine synthase-like glycosyltransferase
MLISSGLGHRTLNRGKTLERSLTILLPVHDAQSTLAETVGEVLEVASDLSDRFELLIIDDGSTDATGEVAAELTRHYPQIRILRHHRRLGNEAAVRTGLAESSGELVFVRQEGRRALEKIHRLGKPARPNYLGRVKQFALGQ